MKEFLNDKRVRIVIIFFLVLIPIVLIASNVYRKETNNREVKNEEKYKGEKSIDGLGFISSIAGVRANNVEIINNPVGFKGELFAKDEAITNGVNYFLDKTNNDKMENLKIGILKDKITLTVDYNVMFNIKTPIEVSASPRLNENGDLVIEILEVRFLDLKVADFIVNIALNSFIKDWFPSEGEIDVTFNKGEVIVSKSEFDGVELKKLEVVDGGVNLGVLINLEKLRM